MRKILLGALVLSVLLSCSNREAAIPAYITVNEFSIETDFAKEGTASSKITTIWVEANDEEIGVFELPVRFPLIANGQTKLTITPGINLNGSQSYRNIYEFYKPFEKTYNISPQQELTPVTDGKTKPVTRYETTNLNTKATIIRLEDFEGAGLNFQATPKSDTILYITSNTNEIFSQPGLDETNTKSGKVIIPVGNSLVEFESIQVYDLPGFNSNVYLEVNYKCNVPVTFGVFVNENTQRVQSPVVIVAPSEEWNKIYINLLTEVSAYPNANDFQIFFGAINTSGEQKFIYVDNLKLVYHD